MSDEIQTGGAQSAGSEASVMAQAMVQYGHWTQAQADAALAADAAAGPEEINPLATPPAKAAQPENVDPLDAMAFQGGDSPASYRFAPAPEGVQTDMQQEQAMRAMFHAEQVPVPIATEVSRLYADACKAPPTDEQVELTGRQTMVQLEKMYGADAKRLLDAARGEVQRMAAREPRLVPMLEQSGLGSNFYVINSLINIARARGRVK